MHYHKSNLESYAFIQLWFHPSATMSCVLYFFHPYKLIRVYIYIILRTCTIYTIRTCIHYYKDSLSEAFSTSKQDLSLFLKALSRFLIRIKEEQNGKGECICVCVSRRYFRVNATLGVSKPTICVEDYLICYVFLTNHKHPLRVETAEEWKGYSREPLCRPTCREQWQ